MGARLTVSGRTLRRSGRRSGFSRDSSFWRGSGFSREWLVWLDSRFAAEAAPTPESSATSEVSHTAMGSRLKPLLRALSVSLLFPLFAFAASTPSDPMPEVTDAFREEGRITYVRRCSFCHGLLGDGNGPAADYLDPRPRDFTLGIFKFRTTQSGELPTDEDLFRTVSAGLTGTGMQAFDDGVIKNGLDERERWAAIAYIKTFAMEFDDPEFDPVANDMLISLPESQPAYNEESIANGKDVFERAKCWECHGKEGRGDGQESFDRTDDWGFPIRIRNVTHPWRIKAGTDVADIYMRFSTGILGTPMPSFVDALSEADRWYLANYIKSLQHQRTEHEVLSALRVDDALTDDPRDSVWDDAAPMDVRLGGQVIAPPRWQNPSIDLVTMRAIYNDEEIAFLLTWDDPFKDASHDVSQELDTQELASVDTFNSYVAANDVIPRALETFRDAIALQFPVKVVAGTKKPHLLRGNSSNPVQLWTWSADRQERGEPSVTEAIARGWKQSPKPQAPEEQQISGNAVWEGGRWHVVMKRPRVTEDRNDVQFIEGRFIPVSINVWDGSNGEHGLIMSLSSWYYVALEAPTPFSVYAFALLAVIVTGGLGVQLMRRAEQEPSR